MHMFGVMRGKLALLVVEQQLVLGMYQEFWKGDIASVFYGEPWRFPKQKYSMTLTRTP